MYQKLIDEEAKKQDLAGQIVLDFDTMGMVAIPLNNHSLALTFDGSYTEEDKKYPLHAKVFMRQADAYPYQKTHWRLDLTVKVQKYTDDKDLNVEKYKTQIDKALTNFFKNYYFWHSDLNQLSSLGYLGGMFLEAAYKVSGKISALYTGLIFDFSATDLQFSDKQFKDSPIQVMEAEDDKAVHMQIDQSMLDEMIEYWKVVKS